MDLSAWSHFIPIAVSADEVSASLTDFPLYVELDAAALASMSKALISGFDIRFTLSDTTELSYERIDWAGGGGSPATVAKFWVKVPEIHLTSGASLRIYYGNAAAEDGEDAEGVWDAYYKTVNHLNEGTSTAANFFKDVTGNAHHGTLTDIGATASQSAGPVGKALVLVGAPTVAYITVPDESGIDIGLLDFSVEAWVKPHQTSVTSRFVNKFETAGGYRIGQYAGDSGEWWPKWRMMGVEFDWRVGTTVPTIAWHHVAITADRDGLAHFYLDGVEELSALDISGSQGNANNALDLIIGATSAISQWFDGELSEVRISKGIARSQPWYVFLNANVDSADNELTFGAEVEIEPREPDEWNALAWNVAADVTEVILVADPYRDEYTVQLHTLTGAAPVFLAFGEDAVSGIGMRLEGLGDTLRVKSAKARLALSAVSAGIAAGGIETNTSVTYRQPKNPL